MHRGHVRSVGRNTRSSDFHEAMEAEMSIAQQQVTSSAGVHTHSLARVRSRLPIKRKDTTLSMHKTQALEQRPLTDFQTGDVVPDDIFEMHEPPDAGGSSVEGGFSDGPAKSTQLVKAEKLHSDAEFKKRIELPVETLEETGFCISGLKGYWMKASDTRGTSAAALSKGPGIVLKQNRFRKGDQVRLQLLHPKREPPVTNGKQVEPKTVFGTVLGKDKTTIRVTLDQYFDLSGIETNYVWRLDLWSSDIVLKRTLEAISCMHHTPYPEPVVQPTEWIVRGTDVRDILLDSFQETSKMTLLESSYHIDQSAFFSKDSAHGASVLTENDLIRSWVDRYRRPDPVIVEGDPEVNLNASQLRAMAFMIGNRVSLIQGPPGTGKTRTIAETVALLKIHFQIPQPLLICTYTNVALDNLLEELVAKKLRPLRVGRKVNDDLEDYSLEAKMEQHPQKARLDFLKKRQEYCVDKVEQVKSLDLSLKEKEDKILHWHSEANSARQGVWRVGMEMAHDIAYDADVICATCISATSLALNVIDFPIVFLDEASMCTEAASLIPIMKGCRHLALIGDHKQLPPVVVSDEGIRGGLGVSLFERLIVEGKVPTLMLDEQFRMHPTISEFPSNVFYHGQLKDGTKDKNGIPHEWLQPPDSRFLISDPSRPADGGVDTGSMIAKQPVVFLDHSGRETEKGKSRMNTAEAEIVCDIVEDLLLRNPCMTGESIGIIAPYTAQISHLIHIFNHCSDHQKRFYDRLGRYRAQEMGQIEIKTVDGFQGREKDAIIFSTVRNNSYGFIGFVGDERRLNVGITRPKKALFVVGNASTLRAGVGATSKHGRLWPFTRFANKYTHPQDSSTQQTDPANIWARFLDWVEERGLLRRVQVSDSDT